MLNNISLCVFIIMYAVITMSYCEENLDDFYP